MKKIVFPIILIAVVYGFYEAGQERPNVYLMSAAVVVFMAGMMYLSSKTPSKNQDEDA